MRMILFSLPVITLAGASAWIGQTWRLEGRVYEALKEKEGAVHFQRVTEQAHGRARVIVAELERDGQADGAAIVAKAKIIGRSLALDGDEGRTRAESTGEIATTEIYLDPMFGSNAAIHALENRLKEALKPEDRDNVQVALYVLKKAREEARETMGYIRVQIAKEAGDLYSKRRRACLEPGTGRFQ